MDQPSFYAVIPANVRYAKIKANAKLLYGEITALANKTWECYASNAYFAELYWVSEKQITVWVKELCDNLFIQSRVEKENGNKRFIAIHQKVDTYPPKGVEGYPPKGVHINTVYNNTSNIVSKDTTTQSVDQEYIPSDKTVKINKVIETVKIACQDNNVFYKSDPKERNFAKHLTGKKFEQEALKATNMDLETFINNIIKASSSNKYSKKIYNCVTLYYNRADVLNKHITATQVTKENVNYII